MRLAIVGCGFVADFYMQSLPLYPVLELIGVMDRDAARAETFARYHGIATIYPALDALLADPRIELVLNLTNPDSHYEVTKAALLAGKHVYSEKPLAMRFEDATELAQLAAARGLELSSAPCSLLSETAQALWKSLRAQAVGAVKLVYAEIDDGLVHKMPYRDWRSDSGRPWPWKDEFEVGCTIEHAGYYVTWLAAFFGPAQSVTAFSSCLYPDKQTDAALDRDAPDFSVACIRFESGVVARLTCSIVAPRDQNLRFFGDAGVLSTHDAWDYRAPVRIRKLVNIRRKMILSPWRQRVPLATVPGVASARRGANPMHFCRGPAALVEAIVAQRRSPLPADFCLHTIEIVLAIQHALEDGSTHRLATRFEPLTPQDWA